MPNFFVPMVQQGQQGQRPGGRRGGGPVQQTQQSMPLMQHQVSWDAIFLCFSFSFEFLHFLLEMILLHHPDAS